MAENIYDRVPPTSLDAERAVLGACLVDREALNQVMEVLVPNDFYDLVHRLAFEVICDMAQRGKPVDPLTFLEEVAKREFDKKIGGHPFIAGLVDGVTTTANAEYYALIVKDKSIHRRLISAGNKIVRLGYSEELEIDEILEEAEKSVFEIAQNRNRTNFRAVSDVLGKTFQMIEEQYRKSDQDVTGYSTGFYQFDRMVGGLQPGSLNILAARPSMGKTALALNMAQHGGVEQKTPILIFSLEMSAEQLVQRMLGSEAKVNIHDIRNGSFSDGDWEKLADAAGRLTQAPIFIDDSSMLSTLEFRARARRFKARFENVGLIVVDYLQLMSFSRRIDSKQQEVAEISRALKGVARELEVPVLALSQLSRAVEQRTDKMPQLSDLRDSGAIEQDADLVLLLYRPGYYDSAGSPEEEDNRATVRIAKHRNGPTGDVDLVFLKEYTRFVNAERTFI